MFSAWLCCSRDPNAYIPTQAFKKLPFLYYLCHLKQALLDLETPTVAIPSMCGGVGGESASRPQKLNWSPKKLLSFQKSAGRSQQGWGVGAVTAYQRLACSELGSLGCSQGHGLDPNSRHLHALFSMTVALISPRKPECKSGCYPMKACYMWIRNTAPEQMTDNQISVDWNPNLQCNFITIEKCFPSVK